MGKKREKRNLWGREGVCRTKQPSPPTSNAIARMELNMLISTARIQNNKNSQQPHRNTRRHGNKTQLDKNITKKHSNKKDLSRIHRNALECRKSWQLIQADTTHQHQDNTWTLKTLNKSEHNSRNPVFSCQAQTRPGLCCLLQTFQCTPWNRPMHPSPPKSTFWTSCRVHTACAAPRCHPKSSNPLLWWQWLWLTTWHCDNSTAFCFVVNTSILGPCIYSAQPHERHWGIPPWFDPEAVNVWQFRLRDRHSESIGECLGGTKGPEQGSRLDQDSLLAIKLAKFASYICRREIFMLVNYLWTSSGEMVGSHSFDLVS